MVIYKTANLINGKYYIGKDSKNYLNYLGSGIAIKKAIKKYGKENFTKEILCFCKSLEELADKEKEYITTEIINDPSSYNMILGGIGGSVKGRKNILKGKTYEEIFGKEKAEELKKIRSTASKGQNNGMYGKHLTAGSKNGMYGKPSPNRNKELSKKTKDKIKNKFIDKSLIDRFGLEEAINIKKRMSISQKNRDRKYLVDQIDNEGKKIGEFKTIVEAIKKLNLSSKKAYANSYKEFKFIKNGTI
jgi:hypothetical protein